MNLTKNIDPTKVNFVCPRCQRIYYQADIEDFNENSRKVTADAKRYKSHYHSCKRKPFNQQRKKTRGGKR